MTISLVLLAVLCPLAFGFSETVPLLAWSSQDSNSLDRLPPNIGSASSLLEGILLNHDVCQLDAVIIASQPGLHASDLRALPLSSKLVQFFNNAPSRRQFQYLTTSSDFDPSRMAEALSARCGSQFVTFTLGSTQGHYSRTSKNVVSIDLPPLIGEMGGIRKSKVSLYTSELADELAYLSSAFQHYLIIYTGSLSDQYSFHESPQFDSDVASDFDFPSSPPVRSVFDFGYALDNTTLPEGGILKRYQLLTPGLITVLLVTAFVLLPVVIMGFMALASIQSSVRVEPPRGFSATDKKMQ